MRKEVVAGIMLAGLMAITLGAHAHHSFAANFILPTWINAATRTRWNTPKCWNLDIRSSCDKTYCWFPTGTQCDESDALLRVDRFDLDRVDRRVPLTPGREVDLEQPVQDLL